MSTLNLDEKRTLLVVGGIIVAGAVVGILWGRLQLGAPPARADITTPVIATPRVPQATGAERAAPAPPSSAAPGEVELAKLAEESMVGAASSRVAAIARIARAPREQALPLLKRALLNGDPAIDRPAALRGLRELALAQGDGDGRIRDAVREVIYHGDDEASIVDARETLDVIAASEEGVPRDHGAP